MKNLISKLLFDKRDHALLSIVNEVLKEGKSTEYIKRKFYPFFHPHGIKEMTESRGLRLAYSVVHILNSIELGAIDERLNALRALRDEILITAEGSMSKNTGRVLLQIMKEIVRAHGNYNFQLKLAHDFRVTASGKPRIVREMLKTYHLLEMPEEWNQLSFDDHVHDVNTKGRKSPAHLMMDAWIKGIRRLRVIYYSHIQPQFAAELIEAAQLMDITLRIGIEFPTRFRNNYAQIIWVPRGFPDAQAFLCFLAENNVTALMEKGRNLSEYRQKYVFSVLEEFNKKHRLVINDLYSLNLESIQKLEFLNFVGSGQSSLLHLGSFIMVNMLPAMQKKVEELRSIYDKADVDEKKRIEALLSEMNKISSEDIVEKYLEPDKNPDIFNPNVPSDNKDIPELLTLRPYELLEKLVGLTYGYRLTLNLSNLRVEDVIEILYESSGKITRLEIFNLKDYTSGIRDHIPDIIRLQEAINASNVIPLKNLMQEVIKKVEDSSYFDKIDRVKRLTNILHDISDFKDMYKVSFLKSRIGSDSTGRSSQMYGMGLSVIDTLPLKTQNQIKKLSKWKVIPINVRAYKRKTFIPQEDIKLTKALFYRLLNKISFFKFIAYEITNDWLYLDHSTRMTEQGNIVALGGIHEDYSNELFITPKKEESSIGFAFPYLRTKIKNILKVIAGFIPAFLTFALTNDWWLLAYFGAFIWFGITGLRNIFQSVLGGGGLKRSPLLRWKEYVSWERITDSLLFTGFSVPLLDYFTKTLILNQTFSITTKTEPILLYGIMALVNGIYLVSHNFFRGLPREAVVGNFFRSVISIPVAILFNFIVGSILIAVGVPNIFDILQKWAAIISKTASDCVAGFIEGLADRKQNINIRLREYENKIDQFFDAYTKLEALYPASDVMEMLKTPSKIKSTGNTEAIDIANIIIINTLDLLYFWMYQPRARDAFRETIAQLSPVERTILLEAQSILIHRQKEICLLFIDAIVGTDFSRALSFYLDRSPEYIAAINKLEKNLK
ncbi:MAG: hypothetical protein HQK76_10905 [Desulfobacterales bacterium]|nr:hypothetical protein [Desulfobacterales bacterium]